MIVLGNWSYLHCPKPQDYELDRIENGKYHYKLIKPHKNKRDELILEDDIQNVVKEIWRQSNGCNFGCCQYNSFHVEITEEEQKVSIQLWRGILRKDTKRCIHWNQMKQTIKHEFFLIKPHKNKRDELILGLL